MSCPHRSEDFADAVQRPTLWSHMRSPAASGDWGKSLDQLRRGGNGLLVTLDQLQNAASIDLQKQCALAMRGGRISEVLDVVQTFMADACEAAQTSARQQHEHFESAVEQLLFDGPKRLHGYLKDIAQRQAREKIEHTWDEAKQAGMHSVEAQSGGERALADARETAVGRFLSPLQRLAVPKRLEFTCVGCVLVTKKVRWRWPATPGVLAGEGEADGGAGAPGVHGADGDAGARASR